MTKRKSDLALPVGIDIVAIDLHLGAMAQQASDHGRDFRGGTVLELRVDAGRFALHVPVDEYSRPAIARVPLRHQILVPGREFLGVRRAGRGAFTPDLRESDTEDGIDHLGNRCPHGLFGEKAIARIEQIPVALPMITRGDPFETDIGTQSVQAEQQPFLDGRTIQVLSHRQALEVIGKGCPQLCFLEDIQQFDHRPASSHLGFEQSQMLRFRLGRQRRERDPAAAFRQ